MARWQFSFFIVPNSWVTEQQSPLEHYLDEDGWSLGDTFENVDRPVGYLYDLAHIFPIEKSWSPDIRIWKSAEHDSDIQATHEDGLLCEIQVRLDLSANVRDAVTDIVKFAGKNDLSFLILETGELCVPNTNALMAHAFSSRAATAYL